MREIKFRGETEDGNWVYGYLYTVNDKFKIEDDYFSKFVAEDTIGQYTGLCDKNGKKIYEGDVVLCNNKNKKVVNFVNGAFGFDGAIGTRNIKVISNIYKDKQNKKHNSN